MPGSPSTPQSRCQPKPLLGERRSGSTARGCGRCSRVGVGMRPVAGIARRSPAGSSGRPGRIEAAAEVGDGARPVVVGPVLGPQRLRHRRPGLERSQVGADRRTRAGPSPASDSVGAQPDLERLGGDGAHVRGHLPPLGPVLDQLGARRRDACPPRRPAPRGRSRCRGAAPGSRHRSRSPKCDSSPSSRPRAGRSWSASGAPGRPAGPAPWSAVRSGRCRRRAGLPAHGDRVDGVPVGARCRRVDSVEELESTPRRRNAWYSGAITTSPIPAVIFQKIAPLYSNSTCRSGIPSARRRTPVVRVGVLVAEHEVVQAAHQRESSTSGWPPWRSTQSPNSSSLMRPETPWIGDQVVGEDAADRRGHQRQQQPLRCDGRAGSRSRSRRGWPPSGAVEDIAAGTAGVRGSATAAAASTRVANGGDRLIDGAAPGGSGEVVRCRSAAVSPRQRVGEVHQ